jgi:hypothetical protein
MLNSETLEVAIGMAFLFLLMSIICTAVKEWLEGMLKWRAMDLERALRTLLDDQDGTTTAYLFRHPVIDSLFEGRYDPAHLRDKWLTFVKSARYMRWSQRRQLPSYIPAEHFATAFLDLVARGPVAESGSDDQGATSYRFTIESLRERAAALSSPHLRRTVLSAIDHSAGDLERLRLNIQRWFDGTMDRASGWYKRRTQTVLFTLGLLVAGVLNVDALHIMERLTSDKTFRDAGVTEASGAQAPDESASTVARIRATRQEIQNVAMPVGWSQVERPTPPGVDLPAWITIVPEQLCKAPEPEKCNLRSDTWHRLVRIALGWLITAFAVMLGAPFWFDVLNKFMVIRSTVKPHEKSPEEGSEDRADKSSKGGASPAPAAAAPVTTVANVVAAIEAAATAVPGAADAAAAPPAGPTAATDAGSDFVPHEWRPGFSNPGEVTP